MDWMNANRISRFPSSAGSVVTVWLDASGQITVPPEPGQFAGEAVLAR